MKIFLTAEQSAEVTPLWAQANHHFPPDDILVGQILRSDWQDGGRLYMQVTLVPGKIAKAMRKAAAKERAKSER